MDAHFLLILAVIGLMKRASANCSKNNTAGENSQIEINAQEGELESPGYPEFFTGDIKCTWYIYVARTYSVELEFIFFDFGNSQPCSTTEGTSYLEVREGVHRDSLQLGLFCSHARPEKISTIGSQMQVSFKASRYRSVKFKATYRAVRDSPPIVLVIAGVSTIVGLMMILLLLTLYLKRKRRNCNEENTTLAECQNQGNEQNRPHGASATQEELIDLQFSSVVERTDMRNQSFSEQELGTSCDKNKRKQSQSHGTFARENLAPVAE